MVPISVTYVEPNSVYGEAVQTGFMVYDPDTCTVMVQNKAGVLLELNDGPAEWENMKQADWEALLEEVRQNEYDVTILLFG